MLDPFSPNGFADPRRDPLNPFTLLSIPWYEHYDRIDPSTGVSYSKSDLLRLILTEQSRERLDSRREEILKTHKTTMEGHQQLDQQPPTYSLDVVPIPVYPSHKQFRNHSYMTTWFPDGKCCWIGPDGKAIRIFNLGTNYSCNYYEPSDITDYGGINGRWSKKIITKEDLNILASLIVNDTILSMAAMQQSTEEGRNNLSRVRLPCYVMRRVAGSIRDMDQTTFDTITSPDCKVTQSIQSLIKLATDDPPLITI